jgi:hypothetical protein
MPFPFGAGPPIRDGARRPPPKPIRGATLRRQAYSRRPPQKGWAARARAAGVAGVKLISQAPAAHLSSVRRCGTRSNLQSLVGVFLTAGDRPVPENGIKRGFCERRCKEEEARFPLRMIADAYVREGSSSLRAGYVQRVASSDASANEDIS